MAVRSINRLVIIGYCHRGVDVEMSWYVNMAPRLPLWELANEVQLLQGSWHVTIAMDGYRCRRVGVAMRCNVNMAPRLLQR